MTNMTWDELVDAWEYSYDEDTTLKDIIPLIPEGLQNNAKILIRIFSSSIGYCDKTFSYKDLCSGDDDNIVVKEFKSIAMDSKLTNVYVSYKNDYLSISTKNDTVVIDLSSDMNIVQEIYYCVLRNVEGRNHRTFTESNESLTFSMSYPVSTIDYDELVITIDIDKFFELYKNDKNLFHDELYKYLSEELGEHSEKHATNINDGNEYDYEFDLK